jgi:hypothetical protein
MNYPREAITGALSGALEDGSRGSAVLALRLLGLRPRQAWEIESLWGND